MSTALPKIDQAGKPAGVPGQSRDDLDLYTVPGTEIVLSDGGVGATTWQWQILDQPPGAAATLSTPTASSTNLTNVTVRGSYLVQLVVDGGALPAQVYRTIVGVQLNTPSWVTPALNRPLRIPAKGETTEFNVESSPGAGPNTRGWAQEMDHWFRALASFSFGTLAQESGTPIGSEPFYTFNFVGLNVTDAGGGVVRVESSAIEGIEARNGTDPVIPGGPWTQVGFKAPTLIQPAYFQSSSNAIVQPGTGEAEIVVTDAYHQKTQHVGGIIFDEPTTTNKNALKCSVNTGPNPMTLSFSALSSSGPNTTVIADGATVNTTLLPGALTYSEAATTTKELRLLYLGMTPTGPAVQSAVLASLAGAPAIPIVVVDFSPDASDFVANIDLSSGLLSLGSGPKVPFVSGEVVRVYSFHGLYWVDVFCNGVAADGIESWQIYGSARRTSKCALAVAPYWINGAISTWGVNLSGTQTVIDVRQFGSVGKLVLQDTTIQVIDRISSDMQWQAGVVFQNSASQFPDYGSENHLDSFGLVPKTSGGPLQEAGSVKAGACWGGGRRYEVATRKDIGSLLLPANSAVCVYVSIKAGVASINGFVVSSGNPIDAVSQCLEINKKTPFNPPALAEIRVPLYFGRLNATADALIADGRIDLRRDVAHYGQWTAAERDPSTATLALIGQTFRSRPARMIANNWDVAGRAIAEFNSISAALAWHGALTSSDNLTPLAPIDGAAQNYVPTTIRVLGDTRENFPIHLRNNVTVRGEGAPFVYVAPSKWWSDFGIATYGWTYLNVGDKFSTNKFVYNVEIRDLTVALISYDRTVQGAGGTYIAALTIWAGDYNSATTDPPIDWTLLGTTQAVRVDNVSFDVISSNLTTSDLVSAILLQDTTGPIAGGNFNNIILRNCSTANYAESRLSPICAFNYGICLHLSHYVWHDSIEITECRLTANTHGICSDGTSTLLQNLRISDNTILVEMNVLSGARTIAYGIQTGDGNIIDSVISRNKFSLRGAAQESRSISIGSGLSRTSIDGNLEASNNGDQAASAGIVVAPGSWSVNRSSICDNQTACPMNGILVNLVASTGTENLTVSKNLVRSGGSGSSGKGISIRHLSTASTAGVQVLENSCNGFVFGLDFQFNAVSGLQVANNKVSSLDIFTESTGIFLDLQGSAKSVALTGNFIYDVRNGIEVASKETNGLSIDSNTITGFRFSVPAGSSNGRGVYLYTVPTSDIAINAVIRSNTIRNMLSPSATDLVHGGGIIVENQSLTRVVSGVKVSENDIIAHAGDASILYSATVPISGIGVFGLVKEIQIDGNKVTNKAIRIEALDPHGGIVIRNPTALASVINAAAQVTNNHITWCDASFINGNEICAAGIVLDYANSAGFQIVNNQVNVQSILDSGLTTPGCTHGILIGAYFGSPTFTQVCGNSIRAAKFDIGSGLLGVCGTAIWAFGPIQGLQLHNNDCTGYFRKAASGSTRHSWGVISVAVDGDEDKSVKNVSVDGNSIIAGDGTGIAVGPQNLAFGIHLGSVNRISDNAQSVLINSNRITAYLDGTDTTNGAALSAQAVILATGASGGSSLQISSNYVERSVLGVTTVHGLAVQGWRETQVNDSVIPYFNLGFEIYEPAYTGAVSSNIWCNNRAGTATNNGAISLVTPPYQVPPGAAKNNWNGNTFF